MSAGESTTGQRPPQEQARWAPDLGAHRLLGDGRSALLLRRDGTVDWWCAPRFDSAPLCWQLLDATGGSAGFPGLEPCRADDAPAGSSTRTVLRGDHGLVEVHDGLVPAEDGLVLVRLVRRAPGQPGPGPTEVEHVLRLGGLDAPVLTWRGGPGEARSEHEGTPLRVRGGTVRVVGDEVRTTLRLDGEGWAAVVVEVGDSGPERDVAQLERDLAERDAHERRRLAASALPRQHPQRALDALAVIRACTHVPTGAVVAAPTLGLPEAPGHDRNFDYRYTWLRDASLSTAVAALLGQGVDAARYLSFVHEAWQGRDLLSRPVLAVDGGDVPDEREVPGVAGWSASQPVRIGNDAAGQRQFDAVGLLVEAVSVHVQVGGPLQTRTWDLVRRLADDVAAGAHEVPDSSGIWELREPAPLVDGDLGRWLVLDRALWIARGWRPLTRRRHWVRAREVLRERVLGALLEDGALPQAYGGSTADASALMAVALGLLPADDPRAHRLVDAVLARLGSGPWLYRYPPGGDDGFSGREGAFLPVSFLAVTALARLDRVQEAQERLDALCARLPRLLAEEVDPDSGRLLGNLPLVWSHAELARALYVLDASVRRQRWGTAGSWAWRLWRYASLRSAYPRG